MVLDVTEGVVRNSRLYWAALRLHERIRDRPLNEPAGLGMLLAAAASIRLPESEARATINSARRAVLSVLTSRAILLWRLSTSTHPARRTTPRSRWRPGWGSWPRSATSSAAPGR